MKCGAVSLGASVARLVHLRNSLKILKSPLICLCGFIKNKIRPVRQITRPLGIFKGFGARCFDVTHSFSCASPQKFASSPNLPECKYK